MTETNIPQSVTPCPAMDNTFTPFSGMYRLMEHIKITPQNKETLHGYTDGAITSNACAIAAVGQFIFHVDHKEIDKHAWRGIADLLIKLGEEQLALQDIATAAKSEGVDYE